MLLGSVSHTWPLRSVTKFYTVTLILQLVDEEKVSLDYTIDMLWGTSPRMASSSRSPTTLPSSVPRGR